MATIKDVAKLAGVSPSTVSRTLSGKIPVDTQTRERVMNCVRLLDYRPNVIAKGLREGKTKNIIYQAAEGMWSCGACRKGLPISWTTAGWTGKPSWRGTTAESAAVPGVPSGSCLKRTTFSRTCGAATGEMAISFEKENTSRKCICFLEAFSSMRHEMLCRDQRL